MSGAVKIDVDGAKELRRELAKLDLKDDLKEVNYDVAMLVVTRSRVFAFSPLQQKAAASLKAGRQMAKAVVTGGGAKAKFFGGAEFGADRNRMRTSGGRTYLGHNQFKAWRGSDRSAGYFLYPAIRANEAAIVEKYADEMDKLTKRAFPDTF